jgi:hypothetical protein
MVATEPDLVVLVGDGPESCSYGPAAVGSLAGFGIDLVVPLGTAGGGSGGDEPALPLSLIIGAWLLAQSGWAGQRQAVAVPDSMPADEAAELGRRLAGLADRVTLLCMGDGSARRDEKAPGWLDERAEPFDRAASVALGAGDPAGLLALDPGLARDLLAAGRASWQVLAGAARDDRWQASLHYDDAPFGVGYVVADWVPAAS